MRLAEVSGRRTTPGGLVVMLGLVMAAASAGPAWAITQHTVTVSATAGAASGDVGDALQVGLGATADGLPQTMDESQLSNLDWAWSIQAIRWMNPATGQYESSGYGTASIDNGGDSTQPNAVLNV